MFGFVFGFLSFNSSVSYVFLSGSGLPPGSPFWVGVRQADSQTLCLPRRQSDGNTVPLPLRKAPPVRRALPLPTKAIAFVGSPFVSGKSPQGSIRTFRYFAPRWGSPLIWDYYSTFLRKAHTGATPPLQGRKGRKCRMFQSRGSCVTCVTSVTGRE